LKSYPIGQGLIFFGDSPVELLDSHYTSHFAKYTKEDFVNWRLKRNEIMPGEPIKSYEPVAYFDFGDTE
jgi:hypothetical protein